MCAHPNDAGGPDSFESSKPQERDLQLAIDANDINYLERLMQQGREWYVEQWAKQHVSVAKFLDNYRKTHVSQPPNYVHGHINRVK